VRAKIARALRRAVHPQATAAGTLSRGEGPNLRENVTRTQDGCDAEGRTATIPEPLVDSL